MQQNDDRADTRVEVVLTNPVGAERVMGDGWGSRTHGFSHWLFSLMV